VQPVEEITAELFDHLIDAGEQATVEQCPLG